jgi:hypothetical protein
MSRFDRRDKRYIEFSKTLLVSIFLFIVGILGASIMIALSDWHSMSWIWGAGK